MREGEWRYYIIISSDPTKHHNVDKMFGFDQYEYESDLKLTPT